MSHCNTSTSETQLHNSLEEEPLDFWLNEALSILETGEILPEEYFSLPVDERVHRLYLKIQERRFRNIVHTLRNEYDAPVCSDGKSYWMWAGTLEDLPNPGEDLEGFLTCIRLAQKQGWPIPTGKTSYQGHGRPREKSDDFISQARAAFSKDPSMSKAKLAHYLNFDERTITRKYQRAGYGSFQDFRDSCIS